MSTLFLGIIALVLLFWTLVFLPKGSGTLAGLLVGRGIDILVMSGVVGIFIYKAYDAFQWEDLGGGVIIVVFFLLFIGYASENNFSVKKMLGGILKDIFSNEKRRLG